ncbi:MAG: hypothetical protein JWR80_2339 [Bradyrhizobium sp.]|nr:hypothetical protein [Bradyrhizobium sp.]
MPIVASTETTQRERELLRNVASLEAALRTTLDYIQSDLQPNPPAAILAYRGLLGQAGAEGEVTLDVMGEFLDVVTSMARFLSDSSAMQVFARAGVTGFADWVMLSTVAGQPPGLTDRQLTRLIGASHKRTRRLLDAQEKAGMVLLSPESQPETVSVQITPAGQARITEIETALLPLLKVYVKRDPFQLVYLLWHIRRLFRIHDRASHRKRPSEDA